MSELNFKEGVWGVFTMDTGHMYIGKVVRTLHTDGYNNTTEMNPTEAQVDFIIAAGGIVFLNPGFEYSTPIQPGAGGGLVRKSFVLPPGVTTGVPIRGRVCSAYYFNEMKDQDRKDHEENLQGALKAIEGSTTEQATPMSPILVPGSPGVDPRVVAAVRRGQGA